MGALIFNRPPTQQLEKFSLSGKKLLLLEHASKKTSQRIENLLLTNQDIYLHNKKPDEENNENNSLQFRSFFIKQNQKSWLQFGLTKQSTLQLLSIDHNKKRQIYKKINGVIFLYDQSIQNSFNFTKQCIKDLQLFSDMQIHKFVIRMNSNSSLRQKVYISRVQQRNLFAYSGINVYAKVSTNGTELFQFLARMVKQPHKQPPRQISFDFEFKLLMIGRKASGKTSYANSLLYKSFKEDIRGICYSFVNRDFNGYLIKAKIFDIPSDKHYWSSTHSQFMSKSGGILLFYDSTKIIDNSQQQKLQMLAQQIEKHTTDVPVVLIGNKADLIKGQYKFVPTVRVLAQKYTHFHCSAKTRLNIDEALDELLLQLLERHKQKIQANRKKREQQLENSLEFF